MRRLVVVLGLVSIAPLAHAAQMNVGHYEAARAVCVAHARLRLKKPLPWKAPPEWMATIEPVDGGSHLRVIAHEATTDAKLYVCDCKVGPGDADLPRAVRLVDAPTCGAIDVDRRPIEPLFKR